MTIVFFCNFEIYNKKLLILINGRLFIYLFMNDFERSNDTSKTCDRDKIFSDILLKKKDFFFFSDQI